MELKKVQEHLKRAAELVLPDEVGDDIEVAFEVLDEAGRSRYICFNLCTVYTESRMVIFSLKGPVTEIYRTGNVLER